MRNKKAAKLRVFAANSYGKKLPNFLTYNRATLLRSQGVLLSGAAGRLDLRIIISAMKGDLSRE